ncbi:MAG: DUF6057 family protein [Bacteroidales bacterium]|nr:DUF6057 family protein [Bacteroidales bacterium]
MKLKDSVPYLLFSAVCLGLLGIFKGAVLFHMEEYSMFSTDALWLKAFFEQPGGIIPLAGAFLVQFCYYPLLGALLMLLLLLALQRLVRAATGCGTWTAFAPSLMLVLYAARMDYGAYLPHAYGILFGPVLGALVAVGFLWLYGRCFEGKKPAPLWLALLLAAGYVAFGVFALLGALLIVVRAFCKGDKPWVLLLALAAAGFAVVFFCSYSNLVYPRINRRFAYLSGLPVRDAFRASRLFLPLVLAALSLLLTALAPVFSTKPAASVISTKRSAWRNLPFALSLVLLFSLTYWDRNFHVQARMEKAIALDDWDRVLHLAGKDKAPTRIQVMYRNLALYRKGQLTERMFTFPDASTPLRMRRQGDISASVSYICAPTVAFHSGLLRTCERWCMELSVTAMKTLYFYKYQAKVALFTGDYDLARKYFRTIGKSLFQRRWVAHYSALADRPELLAQDPEGMRILPLLAAEGYRLDYNGTVENGIIQHYLSVPYVNESVYEWHMAALMLSKMENNFLYDFLERHEKVGGPVTTGIAQAAALFAGTNGDRDLHSYVGQILSSKQSVLREFSQFGNRLNAAPDLEAPETQAWFREYFGRTYWYYYYFTTGLTTN